MFRFALPFFPSASCCLANDGNADAIFGDEVEAPENGDDDDAGDDDELVEDDNDDTDNTPTVVCVWCVAVAKVAS